MHIIVDPNKDVNKIETYLSTNIASIGLWSVTGLNWLANEEVRVTEFNKVFEEDGQEKLKDQGFFVETGSDGNFKVSLYINSTLSNEDSSQLYKKQEGVFVETKDGLFRLGSPEWAGFLDEQGVSENHLDTVEVPAGKYVADIYSLLIKDESGNPKYFQFAICLYAENKYPHKEVVVVHPIQSLKLKYTK